MDIWITRDSIKVWGDIVAWSQEPKWNGSVWYCEDRPTVTAIWRWRSGNFETHFGFLPDCGTCRKMRMRLEQQPEDATKGNAT